jgi:hypothetical protein
VHRRQVFRRSLQSRPSRQRASSTFSGKDNLNKRFNFTNQLTIQHDTSIWHFNLIFQQTFQFGISTWYFCLTIQPRQFNNNRQFGLILSITSVCFMKCKMRNM